MRTALLSLAAAAGMVTVAAPAASAEEIPQIMHSFGYKNVLLGMNHDQLMSTGIVEPHPSDPGGYCKVYVFKESEGPSNPHTWIMVTPDGGVERIDGTVPTKTPRGIGFGSTYDDLVAAHPGTPDRNLYRAPTSDNPDGLYEFHAFRGMPKVGKLSLIAKGTLCRSF